MKKITLIFTDDKKYNLYKNWWLEGGGQSIYRDFEIFQKQESDIKFEGIDNNDVIIFSDKISKDDLVEVELELENDVLDFLKAEADKEDISIEELTSKILQKYLIKEALKNEK